MHLDGFFFNCLVREIDNQLSGSRVEDVYSAGGGSLVLQVRAPGRTLRLEVSVNSPPYAFFLKQGGRDKGQGVLAQTIKKHISGLFCLSFRNDPFDRRAVLALGSAPGGDAAAFVHIELMGRQNDLVLCQGDIILASTRPPGRASRPLQPGDRYAPPPAAAKLPPHELTDSLLAALFQNIGPQALERALTRGILGLSPLLAREICHRVQLPPQEPAASLSPPALTSLVQEVRELAQASLDSRGRARVYGDLGPYWTELGHLAAPGRDFPSLSSALEHWSTAFRTQSDFRALLTRLQAAVAAAQARVKRTLAKQDVELERAEGHEHLRQIGDTILASLDEIPRGATQIKLDNVHTGEPLAIRLDPDKSPSSNAAHYYKRYQKFKNGLVKVKARIARGQEQMEYLSSLEYALEAATNLADLMEVRREMEEQGILGKAERSKPRLQPQQDYLVFQSPQGDPILVGKNNRQNEELTLRKAQKNHFWLHCRHYPGSHVILCTDNPDRASLEYAASLAAWYSKARSSPKVEVVWTRVKNVKKIPGAKPGMVQYTDYRSTLIEPRPGGAGGESP